MDKSNLIEKLSLSLDRIVKILVFAAIVGMIVVISLQIVCRVLFDSLTWSEEVSRYLLVWATFLGATMAYKRGMHIAVTFVVESTPGKMKKVLNVLSVVLSLVFFFIALRYGIEYISLQTSQVSAALRIPMKYVYTVIPCSFMIMLIHGLSAINNIVKDIPGGEIQ